MLKIKDDVDLKELEASENLKKLGFLIDEISGLTKYVYEYGDSFESKLEYICEQIETIKNKLHPTLQRLEAIDNANPSGALECLEVLEDCANVCGDYSHRVEPIKQALIKSQEQDFIYNKIVLPFLNELVIILGINDMDEMLDKIKEQKKALKIIKEKNVDIEWFMKKRKSEKYFTLEIYNSVMPIERQLTEEEFELLKRYVNG